MCSSVSEESAADSITSIDECSWIEGSSEISVHIDYILTVWLHIPEGVCPSLFLYFKIQNFYYVNQKDFRLRRDREILM